MKFSLKIKDAFALPPLDKEQKKELFRTALVFTAVCASAALLISGLNVLLSGTIEKNLNAPRYAAMGKVLAAESYELLDYELEEAHGVSAMYAAKNGEEIIGYCAEVTAADYNGEMAVVVGVNTEYKVTAVEILQMPDGVGTKVRSSQFLSQYAAKSDKLTAVLGTPKDDTQVSAISGATASSKAVTECVNHAVEAVSQIAAEKAKEATGK